MMKDKFILNGTGNNGFRHRYSFDKTKAFKKGFLDLMKKLGFDEKVKDKFILRENEDEGEEERIILLEATDIEDVCWFFENNKYEVDVFFGAKKIIILIRTKNRREMLDYLENEADWISEEEKENRLKNKKYKKEIKSYSK
jgi:hypothetical protein